MSRFQIVMLNNKLLLLQNIFKAYCHVEHAYSTAIDKCPDNFSRFEYVKQDNEVDLHVSARERLKTINQIHPYNTLPHIAISLEVKLQ